MRLPSTFVAFATLLALPAQAALVAHYTFENSGNLGLDSQGNYNAATIGTGSLGQSTTGLPGNGTGSGALILDGDTGLGVNNFTETLLTYTLSVWVKMDDPLAGGTQSIISTREGSGGFLLWAGGNNGSDPDNFRLNHYASGSNLQLKSNVGVSTSWTHVAVSYDGTTARFYINGVAGTSSSDMALGAGSSDDIGIGIRASTNTANNMSAGQLDDVGIWNTALNATEIQNIYNNGVASYVPEPTSVSLLGLAALSFIVRRRRE